MESESSSVVRKTQRNEKKTLFLSDMFRSSILSAAAAAVLCLSGSGGRALAQSTASNPTPPLSGDFLITPTPILTPWQNGASASEGSTSDIGASVTRLTYGPCVYRCLQAPLIVFFFKKVILFYFFLLTLTSPKQKTLRGAHWHNFAWEVLTPVTPGVRSCFMWFCFCFWGVKNLESEKEKTSKN